MSGEDYRIGSLNGVVVKTSTANLSSLQVDQYLILNCATVVHEYREGFAGHKWAYMLNVIWLDINQRLKYIGDIYVQGTCFVETKIQCSRHLRSFKRGAATLGIKSSQFVWSPIVRFKLTSYIVKISEKPNAPSRTSHLGKKTSTSAPIDTNRCWLLFSHADSHWTLLSKVCHVAQPDENKGRALRDGIGGETYDLALGTAVGPRLWTRRKVLPRWRRVLIRYHD